MLNSVVCIIILKMPSDLHCHTDRNTMQGIESQNWFLFPVLCCLTSQLQDSFIMANIFPAIWTLELHLGRKKLSIYRANLNSLNILDV